MKKLILSILASTFILSCSNNSSSNNDNNTNSNSLTDIDGNVYQNVSICSQTWMKSNLNVSHYRNGEIIPQVTDPTQWANLTTGAWCYYNNDPANGAIYGKLYNRYAIMDPRGLAPTGYHIPDVSEFNSLINCVGIYSVGKVMETGTAHWLSPNSIATNESGFTAVPGGYRGNQQSGPSGYINSGIFRYINESGSWWTTSPGGFNTATNQLTGYRAFSIQSDGINGGFDITPDFQMFFGASVRCIKN